MKLLRLLIHTSRGAAALSALAGALSGATSVALIVVLNEALAESRRWPLPTLVTAFAVLLLAVPLTRLLSDFLLVRLGQKAVFELRLGLSRNILAAPLRRIEALGSHRLLVALTDDITAVTVAIAELPTTFVNFALIAGCLAYLGWLAPVLLILLLVVMGLGVGLYRVGLRVAMRQVRRAREQQDHLYGHFHGLIQGAKELKLHAGRRRRLPRAPGGHGARPAGPQRTGPHGLQLDGQLGGAALLRRHRAGGFRAAPRVGQAMSSGLTGFVVVVLFMRTPMQIVDELAPPSSAAARVAIDKVERLGLSPARRGAGVPGDPGGGAGALAPAWSSAASATPTAARPRTRPFTLGPLDLALRPGELVFLVGGNGSGKTTLAKLLTGPLRARRPARSASTASRSPTTTASAYRQRFSVVFSDFYLFDAPARARRHPSSTTGARATWSELQLDRKVDDRGRRALDHRPVAGASASGWPCSPPTSRTGRSTSSTSGRPTRTRTSRRSSTASSCPSSRRAARPCW